MDDNAKSRAVVLPVQIEAVSALTTGCTVGTILAFVAHGAIVAVLALAATVAITAVYTVKAIDIASCVQQFSSCVR